MDLEETLLDPSKEGEGVWMPFGDDGEIKVARMYTDAWNAMYRRIARPHGRRINTDQALQRRVLIEALAVGGLLGWKNFRVGGKEVKYSKATAQELLTQFPALREAVIEVATESANYRAEEREENLKN